MSKSISNWVHPDIQKLSAYHVPNPGNAIKLDAMENPYRWDDTLNAEWLEALKTASINRYPDPSAQELKQYLRNAIQIPDSMDIVLGNGSDELIQMLMLTLRGQPNILLAPEPSFVMYRLTAQVVGLPYRALPLQLETFELELTTILTLIETHQPALLFLAYPNNPTGNAFAINEIEAIIQASPGLVVIDEAYAPFAEHSFIPYLEQYPNLLIMRTLSKLGLAGLRLGFLIGAPAWLEQVEKTRLPYNINVLTQTTAIFALKHYSIFIEQTQRIKRDRQDLFEQLSTIPGVRAWNSQTNFILFRVSDAPTVFNQLKNNGILIKNLHGSHPFLANCLRVTVGTPEENQAFLAALRAHC